MQRKLYISVLYTNTDLKYANNVAYEGNTKKQHSRKNNLSLLNVDPFSCEVTVKSKAWLKYLKYLNSFLHKLWKGHSIITESLNIHQSTLGHALNDNHLVLWQFSPKIGQLRSLPSHNTECSMNLK